MSSVNRMQERYYSFIYKRENQMTCINEEITHDFVSNIITRNQELPVSGSKGTPTSLKYALIKIAQERASPQKSPKMTKIYNS